MPVLQTIPLEGVAIPRTLPGYAWMFSSDQSPVTLFLGLTRSGQVFASVTTAPKGFVKNPASHFIQGDVPDQYPSRAAQLKGSFASERGS